MTMKKYNVALTPQTNINAFDALVSEANPYTNGYCVGYKSIPHITICQFFLDSSLIENIWHKICTQINQTSLNISFSSYSNFSFDNNTYWLSLLPNNPEYLFNLFKIVSSYLTSIRTDEYAPHLTLFNYTKKNHDLIQKFLAPNIFIKTKFELTLSICDELGQIKQISLYNGHHS